MVPVETLSMHARHTLGRRLAMWAIAAGCLALPAPAVGQDVSGAPSRAAQPSGVGRISITWTETPIRDVLMAFAAYSGASIVPGAGVGGTVTAMIEDQPWDVALEAILASRGFVAVESESGIIRVDAIDDLAARADVEPIVTRAYRIGYVAAEEIRAALAPLLTDRGAMSVSASTNTLIVSDIPQVHTAIGGLLRRP